MITISELLSAESIGALVWTAIVAAVAFFAVVISTVVDFVSGIRKARREKQTISSRGMRRSVDKLSRYLITLLALCVVDIVQIFSVLALRYGMGWSLPVFPIVMVLGALFICCIEVTSICENSHRRSDVAHALKSVDEFVTNPALVQLAHDICRLADAAGRQSSTDSQ